MFVLNAVRRFVAEHFPHNARVTHLHNPYDQQQTTASFWILHAR